MSPFVVIQVTDMNTDPGCGGITDPDMGPDVTYHGPGWHSRLLSFAWFLMVSGAAEPKV